MIRGLTHRLGIRKLTSGFAKRARQTRVVKFSKQMVEQLPDQPVRTAAKYTLRKVPVVRSLPVVRDWIQKDLKPLPRRHKPPIDLSTKPDHKAVIPEHIRNENTDPKVLDVKELMNRKEGVPHIRNNLDGATRNKHSTNDARNH